MVSLTEDYESEKRMLIAVYLKLQEKHPNDKLLSYVTIHEDRKGFTPNRGFFRKILSRRIRKHHPHPRLLAYSCYREALKNAKYGLEYKLPVKPVRQSKPKNTLDFGIV